MLTLRTTALLTTTLLLASGCSMLQPKPEAPKTGTLTQRFTMIDAEGRQYGVVEMDPVGGGRIVDSTGRLVGYITAPPQAQVAVPVTPADPAMTVAPLPATTPYR